jgi:hypothetical protein
MPVIEELKGNEMAWMEHVSYARLNRKAIPGKRYRFLLWLLKVNKNSR